MIKKGFTLQELLMSMAIIGIIAAITGPGLMSMMPDKNKAAYLKAYNTLTNLTTEILNNPGLYWTTYGNDGEPNCSGLYCNSKPIVAPFKDDNNCVGGCKFATIFAHSLNLQSELSCNGANIEKIANFTTTDGIEWRLVTSQVSNTDAPGDNEYAISVHIDVNPNDTDGSRHCTYTDACQNPNQFTFSIDNEGGITPTDAMGQAYLEDMSNLNNANANKTRAAKIYKEKSSKTQE